MSSVTVSDQSTGAGVHLRVAGDFDLITQGSVERALACPQVGDEVVLDLSGVEFMDVSALNLCLRFRARARDEGWRLRLALPSGWSARIFALTDTADLFEAA